MLTLSNVSLATGIACGAIIGYTTGDLLNKALIVTVCGVSRAAGTIIIEDPIRLQLLRGINSTDDQIAFEKAALMKKKKIVHSLYQANLGFGLGMALGSCASTTSLLTGALNGFLIHTVGFLAEIIPVVILKKPLQVEFDESGNPK